MTIHQFTPFPGTVRDLRGVNHSHEATMGDATMGGRPEKNRKPTLDEHIANEDKQHLKSNQRPQNERGQGTDDKVDEASQESFPASDPPAQP
jgi:hypothetical protein